jgi:hypothetical protein
MMIRKAFLLFIFISFIGSVFSQEKDFGIWYGVSLKHNILKKLGLDVSAVVRTFDNASKVEQEFLEGGLEYKFNRYLSSSAAFRITNNLEDNSRYYLQPKWFLDLKGNLPVSNLSFNCRIRFQKRVKTYFKNEDDMIPDYTGRIKLKASYNAPSSPVNPYIYVESFFPMFSNKTRIIEKNRFSAGMELTITKRYSIDTEYIFQRDYLPHLADEHILSVNLNLKF